MRIGQKRCSRHGLGSDEDCFLTGQLCHDRAVYCQRQTAFSEGGILGWTVPSQTRINARKKMKFLMAHKRWQSKFWL